jgi:hypothetical protein
MSRGEIVAHAILFFAFGFLMYLLLAARARGL